MNIARGIIFASYNPAGFAIKLPEDQRQTLIHDGKAVKFRFFPDGPIKKEYVLFSESIFNDVQAFEGMINLSVQYIVGKQNQT